MLILKMPLHIDYCQIIQILFLLWCIFLKKKEYEIAVALCISVNVSQPDNAFQIALH